MLKVSCWRTVVTLLLKKSNLQDTCPVSVLCLDYKILSRALVNRLKEAMEQVLPRVQSCCVPCRSMVDNVYLIQDVLESGSLGIDTGLFCSTSHLTALSSTRLEGDWFHSHDP